MTITDVTLCECGHLSTVHTFNQLQHLASEYLNLRSRPNSNSTACLKCEIGNCIEFRPWSYLDMPKPGTLRAAAIGCTCEEYAEINDSCPIHIWVCRTRERCTHEASYDTDATVTIDHTMVHQVCEHCTVPQIVCETCNKVWADWRMTAESCGWTKFTVVVKHRSSGPTTLTSATSAFNRGLIWKCSTCSTPQFEENPSND